MPIKVCFVILGIDYSGAENVLYQYLDGNTEIDPFFVFIYKGKACDRFKHLKGKERCIELNTPYRKNKLRFLPELVQREVTDRLMNTLNMLHPDVIYANNTLETMLCGQIVRKLKIPAFGHIHDMKGAFGTPMKVTATQRVIANYNRVFTVSKACKASWNMPSLEVVYNGIPDSYYSECGERKDNNIFTIGYVGMISKRKGTDLLFEMIQHERVCNWHIAYNLIRDGMESDVGTCDRLENVTVKKDIKPEDMPAFYDSIDILVIPSRQDPLPTVAIEAMARHKLVVGFRIGGLPELLGDERLIIDEISSEALDRKIKEIECWPEAKRKEIAESIHNRAKAIFSQENKRRIINKTLSDAVCANRVIK